MVVAVMVMVQLLGQLVVPLEAELEQPVRTVVVESHEPTMEGEGAVSLFEQASASDISIAIKKMISSFFIWIV